MSVENRRKRVRKAPLTEDDDNVIEASVGPDADSADPSDIGLSQELEGVPEDLRGQKLTDEYRGLIAKSVTDRSALLRQETTKGIRDWLSDANSLFKHVSAEMTTVGVLDTKAIAIISDQAEAKIRTSKLSSQAGFLDIDVFVDLTRKFLLEDYLKDTAGTDVDAVDRKYRILEDFDRSNESFDTPSTPEIEEMAENLDWCKAGLLMYETGRKAPVSDFLMGPLAVEKKVRAGRKRRVADVIGEATTTSTIGAEDADGDSEVLKKSKNNTLRMSQHIYKYTLKKLPTVSAQGRINFFEFFINPDSFSQTIENLFYTSFLLHQGLLGLEMKRDERVTAEEEDRLMFGSLVPTLFVVPKLPDKSSPSYDKEVAERNQKKVNHLIAKMNFSVWRKAIQRYGITKSFLKHRPPVEDP